MKHVIQLDVPRCPKCSSLMFFRAQSDYLQYVACPYCKVPYIMLGGHKSDKEIVIADNISDVEDD